MMQIKFSSGKAWHTNASYLINKYRGAIMSVEKHDLLQEFPEHHHTIRHLKMHDQHFVRLYENYELLTTEIYRMETGVESPSDEVLDGKKLDRVRLKDQLYNLIVDTEATI